MKKNYKKSGWFVGIAITGLVSFFLPSASFGADPAITLGLGVASVPDYEGSEDYEAYLVPNILAKWESGRYVKLRGNNLKANVLPEHILEVGPVLQFRKERDDDVDNNKVSRFRDVDSTVEAGIFIGFDVNNWDGNVQVVNDVSNEHDGLLTTLACGYTIKADLLTTRFGISSTYADDDYMDTYFSVDFNNSLRSGLPVYSADSGIKDIGLDLTVRYKIDHNWDVMGMLGLNQLLNDAEDSPIVDDEGDETQATAAVVVNYSF